MEPQLYKHAAKNGAILGLIYIILISVIYGLDLISFMGSFKFIMLILATFIFFALMSGIDYRKSVGGFTPFLKAFAHSFIVMAVAGLMGLAFNLILYNVIDPELGSKLADAIVTNTEDSMRSFGAPEETIEKQMDEMRKTMPGNFTPGKMMLNYLTGLFMYALMSALVGAIVKRNEPTI